MVASFSMIEWLSLAWCLILKLDVFCGAVCALTMKEMVSSYYVRTLIMLMGVA